MVDKDLNIDVLYNRVAAKTIKMYRQNLGLSLEEVVKKLNNPISRQMLFKYENNLARMKNKTFIDICKALNLDIQKVWEEINVKTLNLSFDFITKKYTNKNSNKTLKQRELLFDKSKKILSESDWKIIEFIMNNAIKTHEENKKQN